MLRNFNVVYEVEVLSNQSIVLKKRGFSRAVTCQTSNVGFSPADFNFSLNAIISRS
jgi:hypothetical protein